MGATSQEDRTKIVEAAMTRRFGELLEWQQPKLLHTYGANDLDRVELFSRRLSETIYAARSALLAMSDEAIGAIDRDLAEGVTLRDTSWYEICSDDISRLQRIVPPPIASGFGHPSYEVDFGYWGGMPKLSLEEVTCLSVGASPDAVPDALFDELAKAKQRGGKIWSAHTMLLRQRELFSRYFTSSGWGYPAQPSQTVLRWIEEFQLDVFPEFRTQLEARFRKSSRREPQSVDGSLSAQEKSTLLKMIAAMACEQYAYDPKVARSSVTGDILGDIGKIGQSIDGKTVRKWLKEAMDYVDQDYWDNPS